MKHATFFLALITLMAWFLPLAAREKPSPDAKPATLAVTNESGKTKTFSPEKLSTLRRHKARVTGHSGTPSTYEGVSLADVLVAAGVTLGKELKGPLLVNYLLVEAADGYRVVFSLAEIDPELTDKVILLADTKDGQRLDSKEGSHRIIVPHDKRGSRWVRQVTRISVRSAEAAKTEKLSPRSEPAIDVRNKPKEVRVAVVITPESSGLLRQLLADFEKQTGNKVVVDSRRDVFEQARAGKADLVIAHYGHGGTEAFCTEGLGLWPRPVFSNQAALIGPASDPARVAGTRDAVGAFRQIARVKAPFVVNNAATEKYLADVLWQAAGKPDRADWYRDKGLRNQAATKDAIEAAVKEKGYTLWGLVPFLKYQEEHPDCGMKALVTDDPLLQRLMVTVVVQLEKIKGVNAEGAKALERFLIAPGTQARIRAFRVSGFDGPVWWPAGRNNSGAFLKGGQ